MMVTGLKVLGDSGKTYDISMSSDNLPTCTCPAFAFGVSREGDAYPGCKHMIFAVAAMTTLVKGGA